MRRKAWTWARLLGGAVILVLLLRRFGADPFLDGLRLVDAGMLVVAAGITVLTTSCCARRWQLIAHGVGADLRLQTAVAAYYRSQFLNTVLPGGVLGDVHRGMRHGRVTRDVGRGVRAVVWDRAAGQVVQMVLALLVLSMSPFRSATLLIAIVAVTAIAFAALLSRRPTHGGPSMWARIARTVSSDLRRGLLARTVWPGVVLTSGAAVVGHLTIFLIAARAAGTSVGPMQIAPAAMLVLLAMSVPLNVAGWGPREGVAAWAFGVAGLGADRGVAAAVAYGVMVFVAGLPGAVVLLAGWFRRRAPKTVPTRRWRQSAGWQGAGRG